MDINDVIEEFMSVFDGNKDFHVRNDYPYLEKVPAGTKLEGKMKPIFVDEEVTEKTYRDHLAGRHGLGLCPISDDNKCKFGVIDIDVYATDYLWLLKLNYDEGLGFIPFRSKSGGLHLYYFTSRAVKAETVIASLQGFCDALSLEKRFSSDGQTKVEIFPKQKKLASGGHGGAITIPYYGGDDAIQYMLDQNGNKVGIEAALKQIKKARSSFTELDEAVKALPYGDAPKCVQALMLNNALGENSGRNNFLFTCAVYLKKKHGNSAFQEELVAFNERLPVPLEDAEVEAMIAKVEENEYNYKCSDIPCVAYCNSKECSKREFGVGREKGYFTGLDYGVIKKVNSATPYWTWELRPMATSENADEDGEVASDSADALTENDRPYTEVVFPDENAIIDQNIFARICMRYLHMVPYSMDSRVWRMTVNKALKHVVVEEVKVEEDVSEESEIRHHFLRYLAIGSGKQKNKAFIKLGQPIIDGDSYYFTAQGVNDYLKSQGVRFRANTLRDKIRSLGCVFTEFSYEQGGVRYTVPCYKVKRDESMAKSESYFADVFNADAEAIAEAHDAEDAKENEHPVTSIKESEIEEDDDESLF